MNDTGGTGRELNPLWEKLEDLKRLDSNLSVAVARKPAEISEKIRADIERRLGFFPPFFEPAMASPSSLEGLWRQQLYCYYDNPIPAIFKEKLSAFLSQFCASPYFVVTHSCTLRNMGMPAQEIKQLLEGPFLITNKIDQVFEALAKYPHPVDSWPDNEPEFEENVMVCAVAVFLGLGESVRCAAKLKEILGPFNYACLIAFLAGIKSSHVWIDAHPEVTYEGHPVVREHYVSLIRNEPHLAELFRNHKEMTLREIPCPNASGSILENEDLYYDFFENANDIIFTYDFSGKVLSVNRAIERVTGYTVSEVYKMNVLDVIRTENENLRRRMLDPRVAGEIPLNFEMEVLTKDKGHISLSVSSRPVYRGGRAVAVQGIARDVTKRKKTEKDLHEANLKLEAWVVELEERTREMTLLNEMGDILRACFTMDEAYNVIVRVAQQIFPVQVGALYVIAPSRNSVESVAVWGDASLAERVFSPQECWALRRGRMHWVENSKSGLICKHVHNPAPDGYLCIPMMAQSEAIGVLHLMQPDNVKMTETKQRMAVTMSEHIAMALSNLKLHETLRSQSIRDPLTGLFNRRFMEESLELEIKRAARNQRSLGMIMMDLDHFKYFNDNFGHDAGDLLLKELGSLLRGNIRGEDIACRYGGEEFTLILPEGTGSVTQQRAEFFKEAIQRLDIHYRGRPLGRITASMGVAIFPEHGRTAKALVEAADKALYRSKNAGRDRVTLAG